MMKEKGITLIALVITIVVMLVLVGVTVTSIINSDLISKAKETGAQTKEASEAEPGQADDLLNSAMGFLDDDLEKLREFFGKGSAVVGYIDVGLNDNIEPIPDAPTSIKYLGFDHAGDCFSYDGKIYRVEHSYEYGVGDYYGEVIKKNYSDQFTTIALQGVYLGHYNESSVFNHYNNISYGLNFETGDIARYFLQTNVTDIQLFDFDNNAYDILSSYNPRLWINDEEVTVSLVQRNGKYCIDLPSEYANKMFRAVLTINGETVQIEGMNSIDS